VWRHRAFEGAEDQHRRLGARFKHVKAHPVVLQHSVVQELHHRLHEFLRRSGRLRELCHFGADFFDSCGHGMIEILTQRSEFPGASHRNAGNLSDSLRAWEEVGMNRECQRVETPHQRGRGRVEKFVSDAENVA
jgi:hypothetical protein